MTAQPDPTRPVSTEADSTIRDTARERAIETYDKARDSALQAGRTTAEQISAAPLIALGAGLAAGVLIAALLPRTTAEDKYLGPIGDRVTGSARSALDAAKQATTDRLNELNLTRDAGSEALRQIVRSVGDAARVGAAAAVEAGRKPTSHG